MATVQTTRVVAFSNLSYEADGDFVLNNVFGTSSWEHVSATVNSGGILIRAQKTGPDQVSGRVLRESGDKVLPPNGQVNVTFVGYDVP